jgi:hypothetical protein
VCVLKLCYNKLVENTKPVALVAVIITREQTFHGFPQYLQVQLRPPLTKSVEQNPT